MELEGESEDRIHDGARSEGGHGRVKSGLERCFKSGGRVNMSEAEFRGFEHTRPGRKGHRQMQVDRFCTTESQDMSWGRGRVLLSSYAYLLL